MIVHFGADVLAPEWPGAVVCIGVFDGIHLGHQRVIRTAVELSQQAELPCVLVTFAQNPAAILRPATAPPALQTLGQNLNHVRRLDVPAAVVLEFNTQLAATSAQEFLDAFLSGKLKAKQLVVGHDFAMGHDRQGTAAWLQQQIQTTVVPALEIDGVRVSSSLIRGLVGKAEMDQVPRYLGRPFLLEGIVVGGQKLGRQLGFPTVNLARSQNQLVPPNGIYAARAKTSKGTYAAALSIGVRPAVDGQSRTIEAYLLDYPGDLLYAQSLEIDILRFLRPEENYDNLDLLKAQIARDVEQTRELVASVPM